MKKSNVLLAALLTLAVGASSVLAQNGDRPQRQRGDGAQRPQFERPNLKPTLFANLGDGCYTPDGMTVHDQNGKLYLNVPNFGRMDDKMVKADSAQGGYLYEVAKDGSSKKILEYPVLEKTGQAGPMGLDCGPDGNLYVCDNQYFHNHDYCSRILRVVFKDGEPTGEVQTVIEGVKLANGMTWCGDKLFYTDSNFDEESFEEGNIGSGGVFMFTADEVLKAGKDGVPPIKIKAGKDEKHCVAYVQVAKLGREDNTGPDGICADKDGVIWFGNFGNGFIYALRPNEAGEYKQENVENVFDALNQRPSRQGLKLQCCDGIYYDKNLDRVFIDDSQGNAIWMFKPVAKGEKIRPVVLWNNPDNDGMEGLLDQPCEACVYAGKLVLANFDWPFPGLMNSKVDPPGTLSGIDYAEIEKMVKITEAFGNRRPQGQRPDGQRPEGRRPNGQRRAR